MKKRAPRQHPFQTCLASVQASEAVQREDCLVHRTNSEGEIAHKCTQFIVNHTHLLACVPVMNDTSLHPTYLTASNATVPSVSSLRLADVEKRARRFTHKQTRT